MEPRVAVGEHEHPEAGLGTDDEVDDAGAFLEQLLGREQAGRLLDPLRLRAGHPALADAEPRRVGGARHLGGDLGAVGEARDVLRSLEHVGGEAGLRLGRAAVVHERLDVAEHDRREAHHLGLAGEVHDHARLIAVGIGEHDAGGVGPDLQDRSEGAIELGVQEDEVLAVVDGGDSRLGTELDLAGGLDDALDAVGGGDEHRIVGDRPLAALDRSRQLRRRGHAHEVVDADVRERLGRFGERAVGDDGDIHARRRLQHLVDESAPGEPGADHAQSYRVAGVLSGPQGLVDDDHDELLSSRRSAQLMSFSETITPSVIGQSIPRAGSSQRMPVSAPGVYGDETP